MRDPAYLAWIRDRPCALCGRPEGVVAHHEQAHGHGIMGGKCADSRTIPLCPIHHHDRHLVGRSWWNRWGKDPEAIIVRLQGDYEEELTC